MQFADGCSKDLAGSEKQKKTNATGERLQASFFFFLIYIYIFIIIIMFHFLNFFLYTCAYIHTGLIIVIGLKMNRGAKAREKRRT